MGGVSKIFDDRGFWSNPPCTSLMFGIANHNNHNNHIIERLGETPTFSQRLNGNEELSVHKFMSALSLYGFDGSDSLRTPKT